MVSGRGIGDGGVEVCSLCAGSQGSCTTVVAADVQGWRQSTEEIERCFGRATLRACGKKGDVSGFED